MHVLATGKHWWDYNSRFDTRQRCYVKFAFCRVCKLEKEQAAEASAAEQHSRDIDG